MDRLVNSPVFILSTARAGSTLLQRMMNAHSLIRAGHELHLCDVTVNLEAPGVQIAMRNLGLSRRDLENMLWDRVLHHELVRSGKQVIVDKNPDNSLNWRRISDYWPDARYIFLLRHPGSTLRSVIEMMHNEIIPFVNGEQGALNVTGVDGAALYYIKKQLNAITAARDALSGLTVRYEELVTDPVGVTQEICSYLGVPWERGMPEYGKSAQDPIGAFLGDTSSNIRSGQVQPGKLPPAREEIPDGILAACQALGYSA